MRSGPQRTAIGECVRPPAEGAVDNAGSAWLLHTIPDPSAPIRMTTDRLYHPHTGLLPASDLRRAGHLMNEELARSMKELRRPGHPRVYYLSYLFRNERRESIFGRLGAIAEHQTAARNFVFCDVRVGSHRYDQVGYGGLRDNDDADESVDYIGMPAEISEDAFKFALWRLTDARYREAAEQYYERKSKELHYVDEQRGLASKVKAKGVRSAKIRRFPEVDVDYWTWLIRKASGLLKSCPAIQVSDFEFVAWHRQQMFVDSEGAEIAQQTSVFDLAARYWLLTPKGAPIEQEAALIVGDLADLPSEKELLRIVKARIELILALSRAPHLNAFSGPVLLGAVPAGLFFHEVVGHRLEGSRLLSSDEGATFADLRGKHIAPAFVDIVDDPTLERFNGKRLIGHFRYDDEGSPAKRAVLVEKGVLRGFLTTSAPIPGQSALNGHARNARHERPISRMGNLLVVNREPVAEPELWERFLEEIRRRKAPFGIWVRETLGGETYTTKYDFQAFKGEIMHAVRVFPSGRKELVRGVDFVGTPLSALDALLCMGDDPTVDNAFCGAESGQIPVSTIAPSALLGNLELQSKDRQKLTQFAMKPPHGLGKRQRS